MKKYFVIIALLLFLTFKASAQTRGIKIGYIDMEYILQNVPDYAEAKNQLEQKANKWKQDIEAKKVEIAKLKDALKTERALLTKELIDEREEEIKFQEDELLDFQQKRFGPNGDLITQKAVLVKPIQDQVFNAVQDIAELKKYDYIFDKSSDLTMLFAAKRHDVSDQVVRAITRAEKRGQVSKKQLQEEEAKEYKENVEDENPALAARRKILEEKKLEREKLAAERKAQAEQKRKDQEEKRNAAMAEKEAKKTATTDGATAKENPADNTARAEDKAKADEAAREAKATERAKIIEDRKKALEEKKKAQLEEREAKKAASADGATAKEKPADNTTRTEDKVKADEAAREAKAAEQVKIIEDRKKALEEKKKAQLEEREAQKTGTIPAKEKPTENKNAPEAKTEKTIPAETSKDDKAAIRAKLIEDRKKALEEKRKKMIEDREAAKKAHEEKTATPKTEEKQP